MTKEELLDEFIEEGTCTNSFAFKLLNKFFESNVCIPKGTNRHPYADVLHALAEDITTEVEISNICNTWIKPIALYESKYRIKPSEPVYEWQWYRFHDGKLVICEHYKTEKEIKIYWNGHHQFAKPFEETKRVRQ